MTTLNGLQVEQMTEPLGLWTDRPRFSWKLDAASASGLRQAVYELEVVNDVTGATVAASGQVASPESVLVEAEGLRLNSATPYRWRVRVWVDGDTSPTVWAHSRFETTLLAPVAWDADWIEPQQETVRKDGASTFPEMFSLRIDTPPEERLLPTPYVRQRLALEDVPVRARLYATAHGIYQAEINGQAVSDELFAPGSESYDKYVSFHAYDVTPHLSAGENVVGFVLSDGWYAGRAGIFGASRPFGDRLRVSWELHTTNADGTTRVFRSDASALGSTSGPIRYADLAVGEYFDARIDWSGWSSPRFDDAEWDPVNVVEVSQTIVPFIGEPVRRVRELPGREIIRTPVGETVVDFGQVIAGRVRFRVRGGAGDVVRLEHTEVLDEHGNYLNNILGPNKDQTDVYVLTGGREEEWEPAFTFHGFRFVRLSGFPDDVSADDFTAVVTSSDLAVIGEFECSDPRLSRLHENVRWSQIGNFLSIPTDCPQRERYGWTGDLQVFAPTAATNMAVGQFLTRWLQNVRADQLPDGRVLNITPTPPPLAYIQELPPPSYDDEIMLLTSAAGWGDVIAVAPWVLYEHYRDHGVLRDNYDAMCAWTEYQIRSAEAGVPPRLEGRELTAEDRERQKLLWNNEPNFGDWLAPSTMRGPDGGHHVAPRATGEVVGSLFHGRLLEQVAEIAAVLGRADDAARFAERCQRVKAAFAAEYIDDDGRIPGGLQGPYVLALAFDFVPEELRERTFSHLVELIEDADLHLDTGFLSVPFLLDVLSDNGRTDLARALLFQTTAPSWLYEVEQGATTIWEGWEAIQPDGTVTELSYNHYAFGCVDDWMYRRLGGLQIAEPGYRRSLIQPEFVPELEWVRASIDTPYGRLESSWRRRTDDAVELRVLVPANTEATIVLPHDAAEVRMSSAVGSDELVDSGITVGSGESMFVVFPARDLVSRAVVR